MASFPSSRFSRNQNQHGAATITISSDSGGSSVHSIVDVSSDDEATSKRRWSLEDERAVLATIADLRMRVNGGMIPPASAILDELRRNGALTRCGVSARKLSRKVYNLRRKFATSAKKAAANGGKLKRRTKHRDKKLYEESQDVWPEMLEDGGYSYLQARPARRR